MTSVSSEMNSRLLLGAALIIACVLMLPAFQGTPLIIDEHVAFWILDADGPGTLWSRSLDCAATPPLSSLVQRLFLLLGGRSESVFRASSVICFLLAIVVTWQIGRQVFGDLAGGLAATILAWHPEVLDCVRIARPYGLTVLLAAVAVWTTMNWERRPRSRRWQAGWILACAALAWTHYVNVPLVVLLWLGLWGNRWLPHTISHTRLLQSAAVVAVLSLPLVRPVWRLFELSRFLNYQVEPLGLGDIVHPFWWAGLPAALIAAVLTGKRASARVTGSEGRASVLKLVLWSVVPLLGILAVSRGNMTSLADPRYRVVYAPAAAVLIAGLLSFRVDRWGALIGVVVLIALSSVVSGDAPWRSQYLDSPNAEDWRQTADKIRRDGQPDDLILAQTGLVESNLVAIKLDDPVFLDYVASRIGRFYLRTSHRRVPLPSIYLSGTGIERFYEGVMNETSAKNASLWIAGTGDTDVGRESIDWIIIQAEHNGLTRVDRFRLGSVVLLRYRRTRAR